MIYIILSYLNKFNLSLKAKGANLLLLLLLCKFSYTQNCEWAKSCNGNGYNNGSTTICSDKDGNIYMVGYFSANTFSLGTFTLTNTLPDTGGNRDAFIVKYNSQGIVLWAKKIGGDNTEWPNSVCTDKDGNVYVTGDFKSSILVFNTYTLTNLGGYDGFVAKYDSQGNILWARSIGSEGNDGCYGARTDSQGNVYLTGHAYTNTLSIGTTTFNQTPWIMYLAKYEGNTGNPIWAKTVDGSVKSFGLCVDKQDNIILTGQMESDVVTAGTSTLTRIGNGPNFFLSKYDSNGNCLWATNENPHIGVEVTSNQYNEIFVTGWFFAPIISIGSYTFANQNNTDNFDFFIAKYNPDGSVAWARTGGGKDYDYSFSIATDVSAVYLTGAYSGSAVIGSNTLITEDIQVTPMFLARYDFNGNVIFAKSFNSGGDANNAENGVCTDDFGNVIVTGDYITNPCVIDGYTMAPTLGTDPFIAKFHFTDVGVEEFDVESSKFKIYPNPSDGNFTIQLDQSAIGQKIEITIFDITGKKLSSELKVMETAEVMLNSNLDNGSYIVKVKWNDGTHDIHHLIISK